MRCSTLSLPLLLLLATSSTGIGQEQNESTIAPTREITIVERKPIGPQTPADLAAATEMADGTRSFKAGDYEAAATHYRRAVGLKPDSFFGQFDLGVVLVQEQRYDEAIAAFVQAASLDAQVASLYDYLGFCYIQIKKPDLAATEYQAVIKLEPTASAHNNLGFAYAESGRLEDAAHEFNEALQLNAGFHSATGGLCFAYEGLRQTDKAIEACVQATSNNPKSVMANLLLGETYLDAHRYREAVGPLKTAHSLAANDPKVLTALGEADYHLGDLQGALEAFNSATRNDPNFTSAYFGAGVTYFKLHKLSEAQQSFNKALSLNPGSTAAHYDLAITCIEQNLRNCALEQYDILKTMAPDVSDRLFTALFGHRVVSVHNQSTDKN